jgi:type 1 fimbriae regulatory protein FimB/type 1 fimbriae regulatory protein FimE
MNTNGVDESSNTVMCKVPLTGSRKWLREEEVEAMIKAARHNRHGERDAAMILIAYRHGLRVSELVALQWSDLDFGTGRIHVRRKKASLDSVHPLHARELRALGILRRTAKTRFIFESERDGGSPMAKRNAQYLIEQAGRDAKLPIRVSAHMLRHGCGYKLANDGRSTRDIQAYLGHANLNNVEIYTALAANRFDDFWRD